MAKGLKKVITLNPDNPRDKKILDELDKQYNYAEFIRYALYERITNNNILHDGNSVATPLPYHNDTIVIPLSHSGNTVTTPLPHDDNEKRNDFLINLNELDDANIDINASTDEDPSQNALDFLKNSF